MGVPSPEEVKRELDAICQLVYHSTRLNLMRARIRVKTIPVYHQRTKCIVGHLAGASDITYGPDYGHVTLWKRLGDGISIRTPVIARAQKAADGLIEKLFVERADDLARVDGFEQY